ncbi:MAG: diacylglycerol/polyprenol kinase family protein [Bdellovibrionia bacterium]
MMKRTAEVKMDQLFDANSIRLPFRSDLHLMRKVWHMGMGLFIVYLYLLGVPQSTALIILSTSLVLDLVVENARIRNPAINEKILRYWSAVMRSHELRQMSTIPHYLAAVILAIGIFPKPVAVLSILYLACGDPIASLFGILYGHLGPRFKNGKSLIGSLAGVLCCTGISLIYLSSLGVTHSVGSWLIVSLLGGLVGGLTEMIPFDIDDNFTIPVVSGFALWMLFILFRF